MKKALFTLAAVMLLAGSAVAQPATRAMEGITLGNVQAAKNGAKNGAQGNPAWNETMSYCLNQDYYTAMGAGGTIYWGIKIEAAALVGRNNLTSVEFYVAQQGAGDYTLNIYTGNAGGTPTHTEAVTATTAEQGTWKTITFATPLPITQGQDLWITFYQTGINYPASAVNDETYENGTYVSLDGTTWSPIGNYGSFPYTWMIRATSDTYTATAPTVAINGPSRVQAGDTVTFTASSANATSFNWNITADYTSSNGNTALAMWNTTGSKTVSVTATNATGSTTESFTTEVYVCDAISTLPWQEGFENGNECWVFIDGNNNATDNFRLSTSADYAHTGTNYISSRYNESAAPYEWAITPAITMPTDASGVLISWYVRGGAYQTSNGKYKVLVSTTGATASDFTDTIFSQTITSSDPDASAYVMHSASLASYGGQTIRVAFLNITDIDANTLFFDDIEIRAASLPVFTVSGPASTTTGNPATFTATYVEGDQTGMTYSWTSTLGTITGSTTTTAVIDYTTGGRDTVVFTASNQHGDFIDTSYVMVYDCAPISTFPFTEDFENGFNNCWTMTSMDAANDNEFGIYADTTAHSGTNEFRFSSYSRAATTGDYNQYLITPELVMDANNTYDLKFWYKAQRATDTFFVKTSTTGNAVSDFTNVLASYTNPATAWTEVVLTLPAATKYVAINYNANYQYRLYVDDIYIGAPTTPSVSLVGPATVKAGNIARYTATGTTQTFSWIVDGVASSETGNVLATSFATAGNHTVIVGATNTVGTSYDTVVTDVFLCPAESLPFTADFTNGFGCWDTVSTTGTRWYLSEEMMQNPLGQVLSISAQQSYFGIMDMGQDNWLISNEIAMGTGNYEISWRPFALGAPNYAADHYSVYVISGANFTDSTMVFSETLTAGDTTFAKRVASVPATVTGNFKIAFRHHNCTGGYAMALDSIMIAAPSLPIVTVSGPTAVMVGANATFTASCANATSFNWTVDGTAQNETGNVLTTSFTATGNHTISVTATNSVGTSAPATHTVNVYNCDAITSFPWTEDFENGINGCWSTIDNDGDGYNWYPTLGDSEFGNSFGNGETGNSAISNSYVNGGVGAITPDNWLITPAITLPADGNYTLSWFATGASNDYGEEHYAVYVATGNTVADFTATTAISEETLAGYEWVSRSASLADYAGQTVYVAFRHYSCTDMYVLGIDDVSIAATSGIEDAENASNVAVYPNPVLNMLNIAGDNIQKVEVIDINGRTVLSNDRAGQLDMSNLAEGVYMVRVISADGIHTQKVVKK